MELKIALAGNPNSGKTTLFNALTGSNQYVGNWPGVTVEKKEGRLKGHKDVLIQDLPGIYSLSPYSLEEVVARDYLVKERPDAILNIVDGTNIERNLYLTTQLMELGLPVVVAVNMMDLTEKKGDRIDLGRLEKALSCPVAALSAARGEGIENLVELTLKTARAGKGQSVPEELSVLLEAARADQEDPEEAEAAARYDFIAEVASKAVKKKTTGHSLSRSDKIDRVVTNRILALPIFVVIIALVYLIAMGNTPVSIGTKGTDWANDGLFGDGWFVPFTCNTEAWEEASDAFEEAGLIIEAYEAGEDVAYAYDDETGVTEALEVNEESYAEALAVEEPDPSAYGRWVPGIPVLAENALAGLGVAEDSWLHGLVIDGIVGGVGAVLGFVPQILVLFLLLAILEDVGYMARIAFIMDRAFRRFGLSGKSFIPMLVATGCGVPGIMASRTIEQDRDRKMTVMTTGFIPCSAKTPIIALFAGALFGGSAWVAVSAYFIGIAAVVLSGIMLKKCKSFAGEPAPFVMELPAYHMPRPAGVLRATWERGWSFIKRAGTIILLSTIILWFLQAFGFEGGSFGMVENSDASLLAAVGRTVAWIFAPLGFGNWQATVAAVTGLVAKEEVVSTMGVLYPGDLSREVALAFGSGITAYSFMLFNLLCAPCFAAMGAIRREMNNPKWTWAAIGYMCGFAYAVALVVYQLGGLMAGVTSFGVFTVAAGVVLAGFVYFLLRKGAEPGPESLSLSAGCPADCGKCKGCH